jgi:spermidine/putrescine transport system permease protein
MLLTGFFHMCLLIVVLGLDKDTFYTLDTGHVVMATPFVYLSVCQSIKQMDYIFYEAALDLGAARDSTG